VTRGGVSICEKLPCIRVVWDNRRRIYAVFIEVDNENIFELDPNMLERAYFLLSEVKSRRFRRANPQEVDYLAIKYLNARPAD